MANKEDVHANIINIPINDDASPATRIVNQGMSNIDPLEVNQCIKILVMLTNSSRCGKSSIEMIVNPLVLILS